MSSGIRSETVGFGVSPHQAAERRRAPSRERRKFATNDHQYGSMTIPTATSPERAGFGPELSLSYDSGVGNSPFGFGFSLSLSSITQKTGGSATIH